MDSSCSTWQTQTARQPQALSPRYSSGSDLRRSRPDSLPNLPCIALKLQLQCCTKQPSAQSSLLPSSLVLSTQPRACSVLLPHTRCSRRPVQVWPPTGELWVDAQHGGCSFRRQASREHVELSALLSRTSYILRAAAVQVGNLASDAKFILLVEKDAAFMRLAGARPSHHGREIALNFWLKLARTILNCSMY